MTKILDAMESGMDVKAAIDRSPIRPLQVAVIMICFTLNVLDGFDVVAIAFAAPAISNDWQMSLKLLGLVFSAGLAGMTIGAMFLAPLTDTVGRRNMILIALLIISSTMVITATVHEIWQLVVMRSLTGLGIGSMLASLTSMTAEFVPNRKRNFAISLVQAGYPVGATCGGFIAAWLIPAYGWQSLFYAGGILTGLMIPVASLWLPESIEFLIRRQPPNALKKINQTLKALHLGALSNLTASSSEKINKASVSSLLTTKHRNNTLRLWLAFFMCFFTLYFLISWLPKIIVNAGMGMQNGIYVGTAFNFGAIIGVLLLGYLADKRGLKPMIFWFSLAGASSMLAFGLIPEQIAILLVMTILIGMFVDGGFSGLYAVAARLYPTEFRTTGIGWAIGAGRFGGVLSPYVGGILISQQWPMAAYFTVFAIPMMIAAIVVKGINADELKVTTP